MAKAPYSHRLWPHLRREILRRDGYVCQIAGPGCTKVATQADHIHPVSLGGAAFDPLNLRAACRHCNSARVHGQERTVPPSRDW